MPTGSTPRRSRYRDAKFIQPLLHSAIFAIGPMQGEKDDIYFGWQLPGFILGIDF
jgi:hypothetical protein